MEIVLVLIPLSLILLSVAVLIFRWAVRNGQYDDLEGPAHRILFDDDLAETPDKTASESRAESGRASDKDSSA
ncbi:cbb3-type cytochrome oxidase assembly protein CcoS [Allohahella marinimesophila]|uniref:Cbb3-type cytochrome oxidase maturation protein n=1 Tax=Allohahella marinimesophila TaxID=1054972 RepID=A0ABP7NM39_9GAMM